jgi:hypothetical protein
MLTREVYIEKFKGRLEKWDTYLAILERRVSRFAGDVKISFESQLDDIRTKRDDAASKLEEIVNSAETTWNGLRKSAKESRIRLVEAFSIAHSKISAVMEDKKNS